MIAIDSSSLIAYLGGEKGADVEAVDLTLGQGQGTLPPVVLAELLSEPTLAPDAAALIERMQMLELKEGYWSRAGRLRASLIRSRRKARLADCLIAQSCLDHDVALITRDRDFRTIATSAGLRLYPA